MNKEFGKERDQYPVEPIQIPRPLEFPARKFADTLWWLAKHVPAEVSMDAEIKETILNHLDGGGSIVLLTNHESHFDHAMLFLHFVQPFLKENSGTETLWVAGNKLFPDYYQRTLTSQEWEENKENIRMPWKQRVKYAFEGTVMRIMAKYREMNILPILQGDQKIGSKMLRDLVTGSLETFETSHHTSSIISFFSLEGGRDEGKVKRALPGLDTMIENSGENHHVMYVPIGITGSRNVLPKNIRELNLHKSASLKVGTPFYADEIVEDAREYNLREKDILMLRVIKQLAPQKWGYYTKKKFKQYRLDHGLPF